MSFQRFFKGQADKSILRTIDLRYRANYKILLRRIKDGSWTQWQQGMQTSSTLLPVIALYRSFLQSGLPKEEAILLCRVWVNNRARRINRVLRALNTLSNFSELFRNVFVQQLHGTEIWTSEVLENNDEELRIDITACLWERTCRRFGCPELCEIFCDADWVTFAHLPKVYLERTETIGTGGERCNFKFHLK